MSVIPNIILGVHIIIASFLFFCPFLSKRKEIDDLHLMFIFTIVGHWILNNNVCMLTELEYHFRKINGESIEKEQTFFAKIINPFYDGFDDIIFTKLFLLFLLCTSIRHLNFYHK